MISVIGGETGSPQTLALAEDVGRELARNGVTLVCGGRAGIMEAACRGARTAGGHTVGILPGSDARESLPNPYVEFPVFTGLGYARNSIVVLSGEAVIAIDGAYGTLSEIAYALIHDIPLVGLDTWEFAYRGHNADKIVRVRNAADAVAKALALAQERQAAAG
jgi:uncharacterized protein (TIGR00725 family)